MKYLLFFEWKKYLAFHVYHEFLRQCFFSLKMYNMKMPRRYLNFFQWIYWEMLEGTEGKSLSYDIFSFLEGVKDTVFPHSKYTG